MYVVHVVVIIFVMFKSRLNVESILKCCLHVQHDVSHRSLCYVVPFHTYVYCMFYVFYSIGNIHVSHNFYIACLLLLSCVQCDAPHDSLCCVKPLCTRALFIPLRYFFVALPFVMPRFILLRTLTCGCVTFRYATFHFVTLLSVALKFTC